jgi:hypothetical protein
MIKIDATDFLVTNETVEYSAESNCINFRRILSGVGLFIISSLILLLIKNTPLLFPLLISIICIVFGILLILMGLEECGIFLTNLRLVSFSKNMLGLSDQIDYDYKHMESIWISSKLYINFKLLGMGVALIFISIFCMVIRLSSFAYLLTVMLIGIVLVMASFQGFRHMILILMTSGTVVIIPGFDKVRHLEMSRKLIELSRYSFRLRSDE